MRDRDLMQVKLKDLRLSVDGTWLEDRVSQLNREMGSRGLQVQAHAWISNEWFSPDTTPGIAVPFYLAHPRLIRLERRMMLDVEGGTRRECMQILRHEAGHVVQHAYGLHRRRKWQMAFGRSSKPYPNFYRPNPSSQNYVQHLRRWYAQSHPDEDFAETFAVWLTPRSNWRKRYADWPAMKKLLYVDELMSEIAGVKPILTRRSEVDPISRMNETLDSHYQGKLQHYAAAETSVTFDRDLLRIFSRDSDNTVAPLATAFLRRNRADIRQLVSKWTGEYQLTLDAVLDDISDRCRVLKLRAPGSERRLRMELTAMLTKRAVHSFYSSSRRQRFAV